MTKDTSVRMRARRAVLPLAFSLLLALVAPAAASETLPVTSVWEGGWAAENGDFDSRSSTGGWFQITGQNTNADTLWKAGYHGDGVGVALIDTGSLPVTGLVNPGTIVDGLDISFDSQNPDILHLDGYGHGVHMAGLIAGSTGEQTPSRNDFKEFTGIAPSAHVISVKAGSSNGAVDVSQIIAAIDWVVEHKDDPGLNIRVLNLSFGFDSTQSAVLDPLSHAVENAWKAGIVVVAAAGNDGSSADLRMPARNPYVIAVGSYDQEYGVASGPVSSFTNCGDSQRTVDLVAPGKSIVSLRAPGSYLDEMYPNAQAGTNYFKGSGTSQSAAIVSGGVALLLSQRPSLTPDSVKALLTDSAKPINGNGCDGAGALDLRQAMNSTAVAGTQNFTDSTGLGSLDAARGSDHLVLDGVVLDGEQDIFGTPWDAQQWAADSSAGTAWVGGDWNGLSGLVWSGLVCPGLVCPGLVCPGLVCPGLVCPGLVCLGPVRPGTVCPGRDCHGPQAPGTVCPGPVCRGRAFRERSGAEHPDHGGLEARGDAPDGQDLALEPGHRGSRPRAPAAGRPGTDPRHGHRFPRMADGWHGGCGRELGGSLPVQARLVHLLAQ